jgi:multicomponent Na+:H+ antiporter subunit B
MGSSWISNNNADHHLKDIIMEIYLIIMLVLMICGSLYSLHARDLLSAVISYGIVGFGLVISFLLLQAPDLAIVQLVVEIVTLVIMIAVIKDTTEEQDKQTASYSQFIYLLVLLLFTLAFYLAFDKISGSLDPFGQHVTRMATAYTDGVQETGSANLVTGVVFGFRAYDTLGEATVLFTAVIGVLTILRLKGKKGE